MRRRTSPRAAPPSPEQALAARMCSASAANVVSGSGSPEKTQGWAVQIPCPSKALDRVDQGHVLHVMGAGVASRRGNRRVLAARTMSTAAKVPAAFGLRPLQTRFVWRPEAGRVVGDLRRCRGSAGSSRARRRYPRAVPGPRWRGPGSCARWPGRRRAWGSRTRWRRSGGPEAEAHPQDPANWCSRRHALKSMSSAPSWSRTRPGRTLARSVAAHLVGQVPACCGGHGALAVPAVFSRRPPPRR